MLELLLWALASVAWSLTAPATCGPAERIDEGDAYGWRYLGLVSASCDWSAGFVLNGSTITLEVGEG